MPEKSNQPNKSIEVCVTPELIHQHELDGKIAIIVDILRATSCMVTGLANGVEAIVPVSTLGECEAMQRIGYLAAAERDGSKVDGFDMGNSPFEYLENKVKGQKVVISTTNGTMALNKSLDAKEILIGAFLNIGALVNYLKTKEEDIVIVCAGWKGKFNWEDTLFAGALCNRLKSDFELADDAAMAAEAMYLTAKGDMFSYMQKSSHAKRLSKLSVLKDIEFCIQESIYEVIPVLRGEKLEAM